MSSLEDFREEVKAHFEQFTAVWKSQLQAVSGDLEKNNGPYLQSYERLVSLNAWRTSLLEGKISEGSLEFFIEAQNDALVSHVFAHHGAWRSALKALRSCIENILACLYYMDHPVELMLWQAGEHRPGFSELHGYFSKHPVVAAVPFKATGLQTISEEYATLSRAVHGSSKGFRMTVDGKAVLLWSPSKEKQGAWKTRESHVILGLNLLLLTLFRDELKGAKHSNLRTALSLAVPDPFHPKIKEHLGVILLSS